MAYTNPTYVGANECWASFKGSQNNESDASKFCSSFSVRFLVPRRPETLEITSTMVHSSANNSFLINPAASSAAPRNSKSARSFSCSSSKVILKPPVSRYPRPQSKLSTTSSSNSRLNTAGRSNRYCFIEPIRRRISCFKQQDKHILIDEPISRSSFSDFVASPPRNVARITDFPTPNNWPSGGDSAASSSFPPSTSHLDMSSTTSVESNYENMLNELDRHLAAKRSEKTPRSTSTSLGKQTAQPIAQYKIRFNKNPNQPKQPASQDESRLKFRSISPVFRSEPKKGQKEERLLAQPPVHRPLELQHQDSPKNVSEDSKEQGCDYQEDSDHKNNLCASDEDETTSSSVKYQNMTSAGKRVSFIPEADFGNEQEEIAEISKELIGFINEYFNTYHTRPLSLKKKAKSKRANTHLIRTSRSYYLQHDEPLSLEELARLFKDESQLNEFGELIVSKFLQKFAKTDLVSMS